MEQRFRWAKAAVVATLFFLLFGLVPATPLQAVDLVPVIHISIGLTTQLQYTVQGELSGKTSAIQPVEAYFLVKESNTAFTTYSKTHGIAWDALRIKSDNGPITPRVINSAANAQGSTITIYAVYKYKLNGVDKTATSNTITFNLKSVPLVSTGRLISRTTGTLTVEGIINRHGESEISRYGMDAYDSTGVFLTRVVQTGPYSLYEGPVQLTVPLDPLRHVDQDIQVRFFASNLYGDSPPSNMQTYRTAPPAPVVGLSLNVRAYPSDSTKFEAVLFGSSASSGITEKGFLYARNIGMLNATKVVVTGQTGATFGGVLLLNKSTTYYVQAYAINESGTSYSPKLSAAWSNNPTPTPIIGQPTPTPGFIFPTYTMAPIVTSTPAPTNAAATSGAVTTTPAPEATTRAPTTGITVTPMPGTTTRVTIPGETTQATTLLSGGTTGTGSGTSTSNPSITPVVPGSTSGPVTEAGSTSPTLVWILAGGLIGLGGAGFAVWHFILRKASAGK
jgi:hypothetical protein